MGFHWKSYAFVSLVSATPPFLLLVRASRISILWSALLAFISVWLFVNYTYPFFTSPIGRLPHPPNPGFVAGHGLSLMSRPPAHIFAKWAKSIPNDGLIQFRSFLHAKQFLLCTTPETVREILLDNPYDYIKPKRAAEFLAQILGDGLVIVEGQRHKDMRKLVSPAFHGKNIQDLIPVFWRKSEELATALAAEVNGSTPSEKGRGVVEIHAIASRVTLDIIGVAGLGRDFHTLQNSDDELATNYAEITDPAGVKYFVANQLFPGWFIRLLPWSENKRFANNTSTLRRTSNNLLQEKRATLASQSSGTRGGKDILTILLESKSPLTDDMLIDQLLTFLAAGHETTSSAITWTMYLLAKHPDIQAQLRTQIHATLVNTDDDAVRALDSLPLLTAITNESLRLFPTVPSTARRSIRPTTLGGHHIPVDTDVLVAPWLINRLPSLWGPDAEDFRPSRWLKGENAERGGATSPYAFLTFLHGPRSCIGQGFARTELKYLLASVVKRFTWEMEDADEVPTPAGAITIKPQKGLRVRLTEI